VNRLRNDHFYLEAVLSSEDDAITIINHEQAVIYWNEAAVETYGISKADILRKKITDFFDNGDLIVLDVLQTEVHVKNNYHRPRKDKHVVINAKPIYNDKKELIGAISVERDITQIVKLNDNLVTASTELNELRQKAYTNDRESPFAKLKGESPALQQTIQVANKAAKTDATTLILGESGTGKEICARAIHEASSRKNAPFIPVNCGAIPSALFESELFGYESGTFTGAEKKGKPGKIELADGGTIFLDEVGELPLEMQVKLLRALQENIIYRIGDSTGKKVDVRFIAATNQNLKQLMEEKKFRSDLYYRLNVIQVKMPPLRNRIEDIPVLAQYFLKQFADQYYTPVPEIQSDALPLLLQYHWPGNVRELRNLLERIVILSEKQAVHKQDLHHFFQSSSSLDLEPRLDPRQSFYFEKDQMEKQMIEMALRETNGNKSAAAKKIGISRVTLYNKMKKYGLNKTETF
jgi:sigma-54 dependent transcriptional regulator, acetoin dehydrogenase operon transcriptional activator AcoR